jgi:hypothetical protein
MAPVDRVVRTNSLVGRDTEPLLGQVGLAVNATFTAKPAPNAHPGCSVDNDKDTA